MKFLKALIWMAIVILLVVGAIKLVKRKRAEEAKLEAKKEYKIVVDTMKLKKSNFSLSLPYLATVMSDDEATISTKLSGRILFVQKTSQTVKKGEVLCKIDAAELKDKLEALRLSKNKINIDINAKKIVLKNAILTHKRTKKLLDIQGASIEQYQNEEDKIILLKAGIKTLENSLKITDSKIKELKNLLVYSTIKAPFDGVVSQSFATIGDMAMPGKPILKIQGKNRYLLVLLPSDIKTKTVIYNSKKYILKSLNKTINALSAYRVDIKTDAKVGERVQVRVVTFQGDAIKVPLSALLQDGQNSYMFIVDNDRVIQKKIKVLGSGEEGIAIDAKYNDKEIVIAKPDILLKLVSGVKIERGR